MELRKKLISVAALAFTVALGAGMATMTASAEEKLTGFAITEFSVRVNGKTDDEGNDTSGLRFKTVTPEGKEAYDAYYTVLSIEGKGSKTVWADTWRTTNDGWNTVVMGIPQSDYKTDITATSYVEIDGEVFATDAATLNLSEAASLAINTAKTQKDAIAINKYIWTEVEGAGEIRGYTMSNYTAGVQYAADEEHVLDEVVTVTTTKCHFTSELRIYSNANNDGFAIIKATKPIQKLEVNAGYKVDTLNIYGSDDGITWTDSTIATIDVTSTSYKDYSVTFDQSYTYLKLDVAGSNQVRIAKLTLNLAGGASGGYGLGEVPLVLPEDGSEITIEDVLLFPLTETTTQKYSLTAEVKSVSNTTLYLKDDEGNEVTAYKCNNYDEVAVKPQPGDTVTLYGALGVYSGKNQIVQPTIEEVIVCDNNKVLAEKEALTLDEETVVSGSKDIPLALQGTTYTEISISWSEDSDLATISGSMLTVTAPASGYQSVVVTATLTLGTVELSKDFTIGLGDKTGVPNDHAVDFGTLQSNSSYATRDVDGWTATNAAVVAWGSDMALCLNGKTSAVGTLTSGTLSGGLSKLTFKCGNSYSESNGYKILITVTSTSGQTFTKEVEKTSVTQNTVYTETIDVTGITGDFTITIKNMSPSNNSSKNKDRVSIWDIVWTEA